jgi:hypothetical protein
MVSGILPVVMQALNVVDAEASGYRTASPTA